MMFNNNKIMCHFHYKTGQFKQQVIQKGSETPKIAPLSFRHFSYAQYLMFSSSDRSFIFPYPNIKQNY